MTTYDEPVDLDLAPPLEVPGDGSVLDLIRERRETAAASRDYDLVVPGYGGLLVLRCSPVTGATVTLLRERLQRSKDDFVMCADVLARSCEQVLARRTPTSPLEPIDPSGEPCGIDLRLAELLRVQAPTARALVRALFDRVPSPEIAVVNAVGEFLSWAQGEEVEIDEVLLGES